MSMISTSKNFQTSVNIAYDIGNVEKAKNFIPTPESVDFIGKILRSADKTTGERRAHILIGPYGKGKSYTVLEALFLLSRRKTKKKDDPVEYIAKKMAGTGFSSAKEILRGIGAGKRLLPIVVNGNGSSLSQAFLFALRSALNREELKNLMPETHFEAAARTIEKWERDFPETVERLNRLASVRSGNFKERLRRFDCERFAEFESLYPKLTSGSEFNPFSGFDIIEVYEKVCRKICESGTYDGLFVVYDEFGKYLESNIATTKEQDVKLLQDFAEKCDRSGREQLHLLLICHKEIENYIDVLPKGKIDGWRGVSERFEHIRFYNGDSESYSLVAASIVKDKKEWNAYVSKNGKAFDSFAKKWNLWKSLFLDERENVRLRETIVFGCFPLHPVTTFILPRLSGMIAQNERTLFTFLAGGGKNSFGNILQGLNFENGENSNLPWITPEYLYDYFEDQLKNESYSDEIKKKFYTADSACRKFSKKSLEGKLVRTLFLIDILGRKDRLPPTRDILESIYVDIGFSSVEIREALKKLDSNRILYENANGGFLELKKDSGIDISQMIRDEMEKRKRTFDAVRVLNSFNEERFLYPTEYNADNKMTRFFRVLFVSPENFATGNFGEENKIDFPDGFVYAVYGEEDFSKVQEKSRRTKNAVFVLLRNAENRTEFLRKYDALEAIRDRAEKGSALSEECEIYYADLCKILREVCAAYLKPELSKAVYVAKGKEKRIYRKSELTGLLSQMCKGIFSKTPVINNEILNKNHLTGMAQKSRAKLLDAILNSASGNLDLPGSGQEFFFMRSALVVPGILDGECGQKEFHLEPDAGSENDDKFKHLFRAISDFLRGSENAEISFFEILKILTDSEHEFGLRRGVIPIYLAVVFAERSKDILLKKDGVEIPLTSDILCEIVENPEAFTLRTQKWNDEKKCYVEALEKMFLGVADCGKKRNDYGYLGNAIFGWWRSLPQYAKQMKRVFEGEDVWTSLPEKFLNLMKVFKLGYVGTQDVLFERIPLALEESEANFKASESLKEGKLFFDSALEKLEGTLADSVKSILVRLMSKNGSGKSLRNLISDFMEALPENVESRIFENNAQILINVYRNATNDDFLTVQSLAKTLTGLSVDDWNDETVDVFLKKFQEWNETLLRYNESRKKRKNEEFSVRFESDSGKKTFSKVKISSRAKILQDEIFRTIDEMGASVSSAEKRQVLVNLLEKLC